MNCDVCGAIHSEENPVHYSPGKQGRTKWTGICENCMADAAEAQAAAYDAKMDR